VSENLEFAGLQFQYDGAPLSTGDCTSQTSTAQGWCGRALRFARNASKRDRLAIFRKIRNRKRPRRVLVFATHAQQFLVLDGSSNNRTIMFSLQRRGSDDEARTGAEGRVGFGGIAVVSWRLSIDPSAGDDDEPLRHARHFLDNSSPNSSANRSLIAFTAWLQQRFGAQFPSSKSLQRKNSYPQIYPQGTVPTVPFSDWQPR
jgi:hypothetical protein